jgi:hypothetical protein
LRHRPDDTLVSFNLPAVRRKKLTIDFADGSQSPGAGAPIRFAQ